MQYARGSCGTPGFTLYRGWRTYSLLSLCIIRLTLLLFDIHIQAYPHLHRCRRLRPLFRISSASSYASPPPPLSHLLRLLFRISSASPATPPIGASPCVPAYTHRLIYPPNHPYHTGVHALRLGFTAPEVHTIRWGIQFRGYIDSPAYKLRLACTPYPRAYTTPGTRGSPGFMWYTRAYTARDVYSSRSLRIAPPLFILHQANFRHLQFHQQPAITLSHQLLLTPLFRLFFRSSSTPRNTPFSPTPHPRVLPPPPKSGSPTYLAFGILPAALAIRPRAHTADVVQSHGRDTCNPPEVHAVPSGHTSRWGYVPRPGAHIICPGYMLHQGCVSCVGVNPAPGVHIIRLGYMLHLESMPHAPPRCLSSISVSITRFEGMPLQRGLYLSPPLHGYIKLTAPF
jgi:hypothetical protein